MRFLVFNVKFSENLGDGVLAECLEHALKAALRGSSVETVDLAGRTDYGQTPGARGRALGMLRSMPRGLRPLAVEVALRRKLGALAPHWKKKIEAADAVIIGGGNLLQDDDLNFPLKVGLALDLVAQSGKPLAIYAVGVSSQWSARARNLISAVRRTNLVHLSVRDPQARQNLLSHFPDFNPHLVADPGLMAEVLRPASAFPPPSGQPIIGLCATSPVVLDRHAGGAVAFSSASEYADLAILLARRGFAIHLFTNGAKEDHAFAGTVMSQPRLAEIAAAGRLKLVGRPQRPGDLVAAIGTFHAIAAHRLHACIVAHALRVPYVGLDWDSKVGAFFHSVGRQDFFRRAGEATPAALDSLLDAAISRGMDRQAVAASVRQARDAAGALARGLEAAAHRVRQAALPRIDVGRVTTSFG
jgi:polysaccharide pyruvyl transferase WcaK-like protein